MTSYPIITIAPSLSLKFTVKYLTTLLLVILSFECSAFGSLFTSPQQREVLNQQRAQGNILPVEPKARTPQNTATEQKVFFNGYVIRKSGHNTAWANQQQLPQASNNGMSAKLENIKGTSVPVKISPSSPTKRLQPGQFLNKTTGKITEGYHFKRTTPIVKKADGTALNEETIENLEEKLEAEETKPEKPADSSMGLR